MRFWIVVTDKLIQKQPAFKLLNHHVREKLGSIMG